MFLHVGISLVDHEAIALSRASVFFGHTTIFGHLRWRHFYTLLVSAVSTPIYEKETETMVLGCIEAKVASAQYPHANVKRSGLARGLLCILESNLDA